MLYDSEDADGDGGNLNAWRFTAYCGGVPFSLRRNTYNPSCPNPYRYPIVTMFPFNLCPVVLNTMNAARPLGPAVFFYACKIWLTDYSP